MGDQSPSLKLRKFSKEELSSLDKDELIEKFKKQRKCLEELELKLRNVPGENDEKDNKQAVFQSSRRENVLIMRLATKEQEVQEYITQISHIKKVQEDASLLSLRQATLDPGVNLLFGKMREELQQTKDKLEQAQSELSAWKFTPDSQNGKKLISRCRTLIAENQELGNQLSQGKTAQLEAELALQKKYSEELKVSQDELNEFVIQLDEEVEGMQSTIQVLQQQLTSAKRECEENQDLIRRYEDIVRLKQEREADEFEYAEASASENEQSIRSTDSEYETVIEERPQTPQSSSVEEGEYSSGSETAYVHDDVSVTGYITDQLDDYEILETLPDVEDDRPRTPTPDPGDSSRNCQKER